MICQPIPSRFFLPYARICSLPRNLSSPAPRRSPPVSQFGQSQCNCASACRYEKAVGLIQGLSSGFNEQFVHHRVFPLLEDSENAARGLVCCYSFVEVSIVTECTVSVSKVMVEIPGYGAVTARRLRSVRHEQECENGSSDPYNTTTGLLLGVPLTTKICSFSTDSTCPCIPGTRNSAWGRWQGL